MPARGGRARSKSSLKIVTRTPAAATAPSAASVARGRHRLRQSPAAAIAANSGHFTHQADASRSTTVAGLQRMLSRTTDAARSHASSNSGRPAKASKGSGRRAWRPGGTADVPASPPTQKTSER
jgi:hypothetical protein